MRSFVSASVASPNAFIKPMRSTSNFSDSLSTSVCFLFFASNKANSLFFCSANLFSRRSCWPKIRADARPCLLSGAVLALCAAVISANPVRYAPNTGIFFTSNKTPPTFVSPNLFNSLTKYATPTTLSATLVAKSSIKSVALLMLLSLLSNDNASNKPLPIVSLASSAATVS